jgi:hypothetical protein
VSSRAWRSIARELPVAGAAVLLLVALTWPLLFTSSGFTGDWEHHLWLVWHESLSIRSSHFPSFFLNTNYSVLDPIFAFYGGTLYAFAGTLSLVLGESPVRAYIVIYLLDFAAAFGGWYWLGRMAGLGRWLAMIPGLIFVTSAYYVMLVYVRGDWPEFTGTSMIPLMLAAGLSVLRADRLRPGGAVALAASSILFFGSHNITMLLALTTLALTGLAVVVCVPDARRQITLRGSVRVAGVVVPAALVSAWYLLPTLAYESRTHIGSNYHEKQELLKDTIALVSAAHLFTFSRASTLGGSSSYPFALSLPVLAIVWILAGILVLPWSSPDRMWARILAICSGMAVLVTLFMTHVALLLALPRVYWSIQFSYRLETYVLLELCAAVLAALALARSSPQHARAWRWMALPVCIVSLVGAIEQIRGYPEPGQSRYAAFQSYGEVYTGNNGNYEDHSERKFLGKYLPKIDIPFSSVHGSKVSFSTHLLPGALVLTNIAAGSYLVHVTGATPVGIDFKNSDMVLSVGSGHGASAVPADAAAISKRTAPTETITVSTGEGLPIVLGRLLTFCGLAILILELLVLPACRLLSRRRRVTAGT